MPSEVWIAINVKAWTPKINYPPVRIARFSGEALRFGIQEHRIEGGSLRVYSPAKTVADCFKFRHKIGVDVALEALRECYRQKKASMNELWEAAKVCRVTNVIRPYMESLT
jgi:predicted transcriptional regulator of viral defense system